MSLELIELREEGVCAKATGIDLVLGGHVILGLTVPIKGLFAEAALDLGRLASMLATLDVSVKTGFGEFLVARHAEVGIPRFFLLVVNFHKGQFRLATRRRNLFF